MRNLVTLIALVCLCGCENLKTLSNYSSVAPKFKGRPVQEMVDFLGAPAAVSGTSTLQLIEWRIGEYATDDVTVSGYISPHGTVSGTARGGGTKFLGCVIRVTADSNGIVTGVTWDSQTGSWGDVSDSWGCNRLVWDPFLEATADAGP